MLELVHFVSLLSVKALILLAAECVVESLEVLPDHLMPFFAHDFANENDLEAVYLDGMSVTVGAAGSRRHIWTFGAGFSGCCPCEISTVWPHEPPGPLEVGNRYFCGRSSL